MVKPTTKSPENQQEKYKKRENSEGRYRVKREAYLVSRTIYTQIVGQCQGRVYEKVNRRFAQSTSLTVVGTGC